MGKQPLEDVSPIKNMALFHLKIESTIIYEVFAPSKRWLRMGISEASEPVPSTLLSPLWAPQVHSYPQRPSHRDCLCSLQRAGTVFQPGFGVGFFSDGLLQGGLGHQKSVMNGVTFHPTYRGPTTTCITGRWVRTRVITLPSNSPPGICHIFRWPGILT